MTARPGGYEGRKDKPWEKKSRSSGIETVYDKDGEFLFNVFKLA